MATASRSGDDLTWTWIGNDVILQTHTAGLAGFDVQLKRDSGSWKTIRTGLTVRTLTLWNRDGGHTYRLRVRARDDRGYASAWSDPLKVRSP
jgi:hypothetical protein